MQLYFISEINPFQRSCTTLLMTCSLIGGKGPFKGARRLNVVILMAASGRRFSLSEIQYSSTFAPKSHRNTTLCYTLWPLHCSLILGGDTLGKGFTSFLSRQVAAKRVEMGKEGVLGSETLLCKKVQLLGVNTIKKYIFSTSLWFIWAGSH